MTPRSPYRPAYQSFYQSAYRLRPVGVHLGKQAAYGRCTPYQCLRRLQGQR